MIYLVVMFLIFGGSNVPGTGSRTSRDLWRTPGTTADSGHCLCTAHCAPLLLLLL